MFSPDKPYPAVVMVFNPERRSLLVVSQAASMPPRSVFIPFGSIKERVDYRLKTERPSLKSEHVPGMNPQQARMDWGRFANHIDHDIPPFELIRKAMLH
jgi:hypothetical protein